MELRSLAAILPYQRLFTLTISCTVAVLLAATPSSLALIGAALGVAVASSA